jgi:hypothetical protein
MAHSDVPSPEQVGEQVAEAPDTLSDFRVVGCAGCSREMPEDEAQAQRWGYSLPAILDDIYPYCPECAEREFGPAP